MDWVLNNLENVIIPIIIMILYGLGSFGQKKKKDGKRAPGRQPEADPNEARRVREIQEEIRRKIAERTGRVPPPIPTREPREPSPPKPVPQTRTQRFPTPSRQPTRRQEPEPVQPAHSYQDELEAKMRQIKALEAKAVAKGVPDSAYTIKSSRRKIPKGELRSQLFADLSNPLGQRKAILVSEILGPPAGIKGPSHWKANV